MQFLFLTFVASAVAQFRELAITNPNLHDLIPAGDSYTIHWIPSVGVQSVDLLLRSGDARNLNTDAVIARNVPNVGAYTWNVPDVDGDEAHTIMIHASGNADLANYSPFFTIKAKTVDVSDSDDTIKSVVGDQQSVKQDKITTEAKLATATGAELAATETKLAATETKLAAATETKLATTDESNLEGSDSPHHTIRIHIEELPTSTVTYARVPWGNENDHISANLTSAANSSATASASKSALANSTVQGDGHHASGTAGMSNSGTKLQFSGIASAILVTALLTIV